MFASPAEKKFEEPEFKWLQQRGVKRDGSVKFYESFSYDGLEYFLHDCVFIHKQDELPYIGKLVKIWEKANTSKKVKVQWFFRPSEISCFLKDVEVLDNELFLASGEGRGLYNINPLEAIAGKCNVVCISTDVRNPQPSVEQRQMANYVFYRTFDVKSLTISEQMNDDVGGLDVKFIFNKKESDRAIEGSESGETPTIVGNNTTSSKALNSNHTMEIEGLDAKQVHAKKENLRAETKDVLFSGEALSRQNVVGSINEQRNDVGSTKVECKIIEDDRDVKSPAIQIQVEESMKTAKKSNDLDDKSSKKLKMDDTTMLEKDMVPNGAQNRIVPGYESISLSSKAISSGTKPKTVIDNKPAERPSKIVRLNSSSNILENNNHRIILKSNHIGSSEIKRPTSEARPLSGETKKPRSEMLPFSETKNLATLGTSKEEKMKSGLQREVGGLEKVSSKECCKESSSKLIYDNSSMNKGNDIKVSGTFEVTRRPVVEKSTWFKELPWDQRVKSSHDEGTLVLLRNLDPDYTSGEVEDIICHALEETCAARMVQQTSISNPLYGQAFAIFKTREAAERVVKKLDDYCLMLPNNRPLVGCIAVLPQLSENPTSFVGHLTIDKLRRQMQRNDAVATSYYSQSNTLEYKMAMSWCLLQSRSEKWWHKLYEEQKVSLEKLTSDLETKQTSA